MKKVLLKDIAQAAGVSVALVSYVLNNKGKSNRVNKDTEQLVIRIAQELGYRPNGIARSLRSGKTYTIGVVVSDISNPFFAHLARCIEDAAAQVGYTVLFGSSDESAIKMDALISSLWGKGVDGMIVVPCEKSTQYIEHWIKLGVPLVLFDRSVQGIENSVVCLNNRGAGKLAAEHLIRSGYRKIVMLAYDTELTNMSDRVMGYEKAMRDAGLGKQIKVIKWPMNPDRSDVEADLRALINTSADAIIFSTNTLAFKSLPFLVKNQVRIPDDLGIVCFDESEAFSLFSVPLTYVKQPIQELALASFKVLMDQIDQEGLAPFTQTLDAELVVQSSSQRD